MITPDTKVLIQGMTGREGQRGARDMIASGAHVVCGVTPGKSGQEVEGKPIYGSVRDACNAHPELTTSIIYAPPLRVRDAAREAIDAGMEHVLIVSENVPVADAAWINEYKGETTVIGPSSVGIIWPGRAALGSIAAAHASEAYTPGNVAIISKSGGLCSETATLLSRAGIGQHVVIGIGGDQVICSSFVDVIKWLDNEHLDAIVLIGEIGGTYEQQVASITTRTPIVAYVAGSFAERIDRELPFGHAGAVVRSENDTTSKKKELLKQHGIHVAEFHSDIARILKVI